MEIISICQCEVSMTEGKPVRADARRNRSAILVAARAVFEQDEVLRFDDFAARAGVGVATLYRHFPTREALAAAVYEGEVAALCENSQDPSRSAAENLAAFLRGFAAYIVEHAALARTLARSVDTATQSTGGNVLEQTVDELVAQAISESDILPDVDPGTLMLVLHGIGSASGRPNWAAESHNAIELLIRGMTTRE
jgi:AcrR family transcriptional regulator